MCDELKDIFVFIGNVASILTLVSFVLAYLWNKQANKQARKDDLERSRLFAQSVLVLREMEVKKAKMEKERLLRKADNLKVNKNAVINSPGFDQSELTRIENEYALQINEIMASISDLNAYMAGLDFAAIDDLNKVIEKHKAK